MVNVSNLIETRGISLDKLKETVVMSCFDVSYDIDSIIEFIEKEIVRHRTGGWEKIYLKVMATGERYDNTAHEYGTLMFQKGKYKVSYYPQISWKSAMGRDCWELIYYIWQSETV